MNKDVLCFSCRFIDLEDSVPYQLRRNKKKNQYKARHYIRSYYTVSDFGKARPEEDK